MGDLMDFIIEDFTDTGFYRVFYDRNEAPGGPYQGIPEMAKSEELYDYPSDGYILFYDKEKVETSTVPSLNPDDLLQTEVCRDCGDEMHPWYASKGEPGMHWRCDCGTTLFVLTDAGDDEDEEEGQLPN